MKHNARGIGNLLRPMVFIPGAAVLVIGAGVFLRSGGDASLETVLVRRGAVIAEVGVTGRVHPGQSVELAFETSGKVREVPVEVGNRVPAGARLLVLESMELAAELREAEANVKAEQARFLELKRGTRPEELAVQDVKVANARISLQDAKQNAVDRLEDAYTKSDDAVRNRVDQFVSNPRSASPQLLFFPSSGQLEADVEDGRVRVEQLLLSWQRSLAGLSTESDFSENIRAAKNELAVVKAFLDTAALAVNTLVAHAGLSQTTIDAWRADVSTARTNVNTALSNVTAAAEKFESAEAALDLALEELALKRAGTVSEQILAQEARGEQARARVEQLQTQIGKTVLRAPFAGIITKQNIEVGEVAAAHDPVLSMISDAAFRIEANVPEADIAKVRVGSTARVTLDAYGSDAEFRAAVTAIDPAETIVDGVPTYTTTFQFAEKDERVKSGMTANIDIEGERREDILFIPQRAAFSRDGGRFVRRLRGEKNEEVSIRIGLRGTDGNLEVLEGLREGDRIVVSSR